MYQALYRKYRPQRFSDVCGQEHISETLKKQIAQSRPSHAYLFTGSRGTGKTTSARILAKAVNCLHPIDGDPCNECEICHGIDNGTIMDIVEIDAASNNSVGDVRNLREQIEYTPAKTKYRIYIIDEVHMLSVDAFNALLKTLEEPPEHVIFILATTEVQKLPATILSRCQRFDFNRIASEVIGEHLQSVAQSESLTLDAPAASLIARLADGGMRDALSLLDLCAGSTEHITEEVVSQCAGLPVREHLFALVDAVCASESGKILEILDKLYAASCDMERLCNELILHYRNLLVLGSGEKSDSLVVATSEELNQLKAQAKKMSAEQMVQAISCMCDCLDSMKRGAAKRILMETTLIRLSAPQLDTSVDALLSRIAALEDAVRTGVKPAQRVSEKKHESKPEPEPEIPLPEPPEEQPAPAQPEASSDTLVRFTLWPDVLSRLSKVSPLIHSVLQDSSAYEKGNLLLIDAPNVLFKDLIKDDSRHLESLRSAVMSVTGKRYRLGPYSASTAPQKQDNNDPLVGFVNKFGGSDVEVE